ncbi:hypothetical protein D3C84_881950 [compost metagenome]
MIYTGTPAGVGGVKDGDELTLVLSGERIGPLRVRMQRIHAQKALRSHQMISESFFTFMMNGHYSKIALACATSIFLFGS